MKPFSIIIPLHNEAKILDTVITGMVRKLEAEQCTAYEVVLIENGSSDNTLAIARRLASRHPFIKTFRLQFPSYGAALKKGILHSRYDRIIQLDIDLIDFKFIKRSLRLLDKYDFVVGSKTLPQSKDMRLFPRILITRAVSLIVRHSLNYQGTDTHGVKAYKKQALEPIIQTVNSSHHFFDTEILVRAQYQGYKIKEIPVSTAELRKTRFTLSIRAYQALRELITLIRNREKMMHQYRPEVALIADDFGYRKETDVKMLQLLKKGELALVSVIANYYAARQSYLPTWLMNRKVAIHVNLTEGYPISPPEEIKTLVNKQHAFYPKHIFALRLLFKLIDQNEIQKEIEAQITYLKNKGAKTVELNSHQHIHALSPISELFYRLAKKYHIPAIRSYKHLRAQTVPARIKRAILSSIAYLSSLRYNHSVKHPLAWYAHDIDSYIMSWESKRFNISHVKNHKIKIIAHPFLPFDNCRQYNDYFSFANNS